MPGTRLTLLVMTAILVSAVACANSDASGGEPGDFFSRDPNAQATIQAQYPNETTPQIDLPEAGVLYATVILNDVRDGHTRTESRFWF